MKLDMVIDMLARLSYRDTDLPPLCQIELSPNQLVWYSAQALQPGDWVRFELYFHPTFREPIVAFGNVTSAVQHNRDEGFCVEAELIEMPDKTSQGLERLALLTQRRQQTRQPARIPGGRAA
jgi:hypothetical protein